MVTCYPVRGKQKAIDICEAFAYGCSGQLALGLQPGPAFFYGVNETNVSIWREVVLSGRDYYYCDNSYFDQSRQRYFRITKNRLQHSGIGRSDGKRFEALGIQIKPWRVQNGGHILFCPQSDDFMRNVIGAKSDWMLPAMQSLQAITRRAVMVRQWDRDKAKLADTLLSDLQDCHALITWSSAAAVTALLNGVPVVTLGQCAAESMGGSLQKIESLPRPEREEWAGVLADNQWTLAEIRDGTAWRHLNG